MKQTIRVEIATLEGHNIRSCMDTDGLQRLAASLRKGQKFPILIAGRKVIDGHRRIAAAKLAGLTHFDAIDCGGMTEQEITEYQTVHAFHSESLSDYDRAHTLKNKKDETGMSNSQLAELYDLDPSAVTQLLSLFDCPDGVQQLAARGDIGRTKWHLIAQSSDQNEALRRVEAGATRDDLRRLHRKAKTSEGTPTPATRANKIKVPLVSGTLVTVAGEDISLEDAIEAAGEALKQMKAALAKGYTAKSAMSCWKDIAAAG